MRKCMFGPRMLSAWASAEFFDTDLTRWIAWESPEDLFLLQIATDVDFGISKPDFRCSKLEKLKDQPFSYDP